MQEVDISAISILCKPLLAKEVKSVFIYGSAVRKKDFSKASDIDLMIILDDTSNQFNEATVAKAKITADVIAIAAARKGYKLHFQPPRRLSTWWMLIREGEPWVMTALKDCAILYDPTGYVSLLQHLLEKGIIYHNTERAEKLLERAHLDFLEAKQLLLTRIPYELLLLMTESAQRVLAQCELYPTTAKDTLAMLKKTYVKKNAIAKVCADDYEELYVIVRKINNGVLSEFTGSDLDRYAEKVDSFVKVMDALFFRQENERVILLLGKAYRKARHLAERALRKSIADDDELLKLFEEKLVKAEQIDEVHLQTLKDLCTFNKTKDPNFPTKNRYVTSSYLTSLDIAIKDYLATRK